MREDDDLTLLFSDGCTRSMTDDQFLKAFESCSLPEEMWTHEAHIRMAWLYLRRGPLAQIIPIVREGIQRYNASLKKTLAYHETITQAYLYIINDRLQVGNPGLTFREFCTRNADLLDRTVLLAYYRKETLFSRQARETFVRPDLSDLSGWRE